MFAKNVSVFLDSFPKENSMNKLDNVFFSSSNILKYEFA